MTALVGTEVDTLLLWERAIGKDAWNREDALLHAAGESSAMPGARNSALLSLRARLFGATMNLRSNCPACSAATEFSVDSDRLARECVPAAAADVVHQIDVEGHSVRFRLPCVEDLRAVAARAAREDVTSLLFDRCAFGEGSASAQLPVTVRDAVCARMEELDPGAAVSFSITCPECHHAWQAPFDVAGALWAEVRAAAERSLLEIDVLARAYGWTEAEILALSPTRRAAYLQLAGAVACATCNASLPVSAGSLSDQGR
jgi:hypothetical protein